MFVLTFFSFMADAIPNFTFSKPLESLQTCTSVESLTIVQCMDYVYKIMELTDDVAKFCS